MSGDLRRGTKADDGALLAQIEAVSLETSQQFLEYLVLQKHSNVCLLPGIEQPFSSFIRIPTCTLDWLKHASTS